MRSATLPVRFAALAAALAGAATSARAQVAGPANEAREESVCLGFSFGVFNPKLDWSKAGHRPLRSGAAGDRAPDGRDWASDQALPNDSTLYLFPSWWPVGVLVEVPNRRPAPGDTLLGRATALVASGKITPPVAPVRIWRVPCGRPAAGATLPPPTSDSTPDRARQKLGKTFGEHWNSTENVVYTSPFALIVPPQSRGGDPLSTDLRTARIAGSR